MTNRGSDKKQPVKSTDSGYGISAFVSAFTFFVVFWTLLTKIMQKVGILQSNSLITNHSANSIQTKLISEKMAHTPKTHKKGQKTHTISKKQTSNSSTTRPSTAASPSKFMRLFNGSNGPAAHSAETDLSPDDFQPSNDQAASFKLMNKLINQLKNAPTPSKRKTAIGKLAANLSFIYRFHRLNLVIKANTSNGKTKDSLYELRTGLVHNIGSQLFSDTIISETRKKIGELDLSELAKITSDTPKVKNLSLTLGMHDMPLFEMIRSETSEQEHNPDHDQLEEWIMQKAIPVLNSLANGAQTSQGDMKSEFYDAIRMMIIIIGEKCPTVRDKYNDLMPYRAFQQDCRLKRNTFAHHAYPHKANNTLDSFLASTKNLNEKLATEKQVKSFLALPAPRTGSRLTN